MAPVWCLLCVRDESKERGGVRAQRWQQVRIIGQQPHHSTSPLPPPSPQNSSLAPPLAKTVALRSPGLEPGPGPWQGPIIPLGPWEHNTQAPLCCALELWCLLDLYLEGRGCCCGCPRRGARGRRRAALRQAGLTTTQLQTDYKRRRGGSKCVPQPCHTKTKHPKRCQRCTAVQRNKQKRTGQGGEFWGWLISWWYRPKG